MCWNSAEAARRAGYNGRSNTIGPRLLTYPHIQSAIQERLSVISESVEDLVKKNSILDLPTKYKKHRSNKVYFIQAENGLIKIGIAFDVEYRLSFLNTASPVELTLLFWVDTDEARGLEKSLHHLFKTKRVRGEWFRLTSDDITWVKSNYGIE